MSGARSFLLDVWEDLRARRLVPVAVLLVAGLVAVPLLLSKKSEEPVVPPAAPAAQSEPDQPRGPEELAQVKLDDFAAGSGSSLSSFDASNPFVPPAKVVEAARDEAQGDELVAGGELAPGGGGTAETGTGGTGTGDTGGDTPDTDTGGGGGGGDGGDTKTTEFTYVIDVTFWDKGRRRAIDGMEKLHMLPNEESPLLIYMGVSEDAANAVFLVDSTVVATGEGLCQFPPPEACGLLQLGAGSQEDFTDAEGNTYKLQIDQIRKVKVDSDAAGEASSKDKDKRKKGKSARAAVGARAPVRSFVPPVLIDLVVESSGDGDNSTGARSRR